jgi:hypothetical protein
VVHCAPRTGEKNGVILLGALFFPLRLFFWTVDRDEHVDRRALFPTWPRCVRPMFCGRQRPLRRGCQKNKEVANRAFEGENGHLLLQVRTRSAALCGVASFPLGEFGETRVLKI